MKLRRDEFIEDICNALKIKRERPGRITFTRPELMKLHKAICKRTKERTRSHGRNRK